MITIKAPNPDFEMIMFLPSPALGDSERPESKIQTKKSMNDDAIAHITQKQSATAVRYKWEFDLTRFKALELWNFIDAYSAKSWQITLWDDVTIIIVNLLINPFELDVFGRAIHADSDEAVRVTLEFENIQ